MRHDPVCQNTMSVRVSVKVTTRRQQKHATRTRKSTQVSKLSERCTKHSLRVTSPGSIPPRPVNSNFLTSVKISFEEGLYPRKLWQNKDGPSSSPVACFVNLSILPFIRYREYKYDGYTSGASNQIKTDNKNSMNYMSPFAIFQVTIYSENNKIRDPTKFPLRCNALWNCSSHKMYCTGATHPGFFTRPGGGEPMTYMTFLHPSQKK